MCNVIAKLDKASGREMKKGIKKKVNYLTKAIFNFWEIEGSSFKNSFGYFGCISYKYI